MIEYELCDLGIDYPDYFQGFGVAFTRYNNCAVGVGMTKREALDDCLEQIEQTGTNSATIESQIIADENWHSLDDCPNDPLPDDCQTIADSDEYSDAQYYVGIRWIDS